MSWGNTPVGRLREIVQNYRRASANGDHARVRLFAEETRRVITENRADPEYIEVAIVVTAGIVDPSDIYAETTAHWNQQEFNLWHGE